MHITVKKAELKKAAYCMILTILHSVKGPTMETVKRSGFVLGCIGWEG